MKKRIILFFVIIFSLFSLGAGITAYDLVAITTDLSNLISLHQIDEIRHKLGSSLQRNQAYTYAPTTIFAYNLDEIIENASEVDQTINKCHQCHHKPSTRKKIDDSVVQIQRYKEKLSYLITFVGPEGQRRQNLQKEVATQGDTVLADVEKMVESASHTLKIQTDKAMNNLKRSYAFLALVLVGTFFAALYVSRFLVQDITRPISELLTATVQIREGKLGHTTEYQSNEEFSTLIDNFNEMSASLADKERRIQSSLNRLTKLNSITPILHSTQDILQILKQLGIHMTGLVNVKKIGILFIPAGEKNFRLTLSTTNSRKPEITSTELSKKQVLKTFHANKGKPILHNNEDDQPWPFASDTETIQLENFSIYWFMRKNDLTGALIAIDHNDGDFLEEDLNIVGILANNLTVALENIALYNDIQNQMTELQETQRQLLEAEKHTAIGTLAGGIAHDFNNILCGMIGYIALIKSNFDANDEYYKMLGAVEQAGFRAASLIKQLLTFARQSTFKPQSVDLNRHVVNVTEILKNTISKLITVKLDLAELLPKVEGDPAQLEQILMNLCVNARDAMPDGGQLIIKTESKHLDKQFCLKNTEARPIEYVKLAVIDSGSGIAPKDISRIFDPFFTTKEFGKGTGLGLSIVYGIVKSHDGFCLVDSRMDHGTTFSIYLPVSDKKHKITPQILKTQGTYLGGDTLLIVDDELFFVSMLTNYLENIGCTVLHAGNGLDGIKVLAEHEDEVDLVILDINMPIMGGEEAYSKMKEIKPDLKVLIATGYGDDGMPAQNLLAKGCQGFIQKPFTLEDFSAKIKEVMES